MLIALEMAHYSVVMRTKTIALRKGRGHTVFFLLPKEPRDLLSPSFTIFATISVARLNTVNIQRFVGLSALDAEDDDHYERGIQFYDDLNMRNGPFES